MIAFARILAIVVFPTPRGPLKRKAWAILSWVIAFLSVRTTCSWPRTSSKSWGLHFLAKTRYSKMTPEGHKGKRDSRAGRSTRWRLLPLLPSGPDGVHRPTSRGARLSSLYGGHETDPLCSMAERAGFEPAVHLWGRTHDFQSCSFSRSDISPYSPFEKRCIIERRVRICQGIPIGEFPSIFLPFEIADLLNHSCLFRRDGIEGFP